MKDRQTPTAIAQPSIPIVSPVLHWMAMPALVYLRSGFGYSFLRSRLIFLVSIYSCVAFAIYAYLGQGTWRQYWALVLFSMGASILYLLHLAAVLWREARSKASHDAYAGTSHFLRIPGLEFLMANDGFVMALHLWAEPLFTAFVATVLRLFLNERCLSGWLWCVAGAMAGKAFINYVYDIRAAKKREDIMEDAEDGMPQRAGQHDAPLPNAGGRKPKGHYPPNATVVPHADELRHSEVLRLMPPSSLEQAEQHYRELIKAYHTDTNPPTPENHRKSAELNEAIEYFRKTHGEG